MDQTLISQSNHSLYTILLNNRRRKIFAIATLITCSLVATGYAASHFLVGPTDPADEVTGAPALLAPDNDDIQESSISTQPEPGGKLVSHADLGLQFSYAEQSGGATWSAQRDANRVYMVTEKNPDDRLRFVEVFPKDPQDTIELAISKAVLEGFDSQDCPINVIKYPTTAALYDPYRQQATIRYHSKYLLDGSFAPRDPGKCPATYAPINWLAYFMVDSRQPEKLLFINVGQDPGPAAGANPRKAWYESLSLP